MAQLADLAMGRCQECGKREPLAWMLHYKWGVVCEGCAPKCPTCGKPNDPRGEDGCTEHMIAAESREGR